MSGAARPSFSPVLRESENKGQAPPERFSPNQFPPSGTSSPVAVSFSKLKKIQTLTNSIDVFKTTLSYGALNKLITDD